MAPASNAGDPDPEDEDSDDISVTSTLESEMRSEYELSEILDEAVNHEGETVYLIRWEGYPLHRSTWEPASNLVNGHDATLHAWQDRKMRITKGFLKPFDTAAFEREVQRIHDAEQKRRAKRRAKRIKLGLAVSPEPFEESELPEAQDDYSSADEPSRSIDDAIVPHSKRKRRAEVRIQDFAAEDDDSEVQVSDDADDDSDRPLVCSGNYAHYKLLKQQGESESRAEKKRSMGNKGPVAKRAKLSASSDTSRNKPGEADYAGKSAKDIKGSSLHPPPRNLVAVRKSSLDTKAVTLSKPNIEKITNIKKQASSKTTLSKSEVKSASTTAKKTGSSLFVNWNKPIKKRTPASVTENSGKIFKTLSHRRRFQLRGRNEPAPDLSSLPLIDPKTGLITKPAEPAKQLESKLVEKQDDLPNLGKFNPGQFSSAGVKLPVSDSKDNQITENHPPATSANGLESSKGLQTSRTFKVPATCYRWLQGECFSAENCRYEHRKTGVRGPQPGYLPPKFLHPPLTCWFWAFKAACAKSSEECKFAHWNTGLVASKSVNKPPIEVSIPRTMEEFLNPPVKRKHLETVDKSKTCYLWKQGNCRKSDEECEFAHFETSIVADPPRHFKHVDAIDTAGVNQIPQGPRRRSQTLSAPSAITNQVDVNSITTPDGSAVLNVNAVKVLLQLPRRAGHEAENLKVYFAGFAEGRKEKFMRSVGPLPELLVNHMILAPDFEKYFIKEFRLYDCGDIIPADDDVAVKLDQYADYFRANLTGGLVYHRKCGLLLHPTGDRTWDFLGCNKSSDAPATWCFHITRALPTPVDRDPDLLIKSFKRPETAVEQTLRVLLGMEVDRLLERPASIPSKVDKVAFLIYHPKYDADMDFLSKSFISCGIKVYQSVRAGSWHYFRKHYDSGLIILHPEAYCYAQIPELSYMLRLKFNVWQLGYDRDRATKYPHETYSCINLFPRGGVIFVSDDLFENHPYKALAVLDDFVKFKSKKLYPWKLAGRPGLLEWLRSLLGVYEHEYAQTLDPVRAQLWVYIDKLLPYDLLDPIDHISPGENSLVVAPRALDYPEYGDVWKHAQPAALDFLVDWFSNWAACNATKYRRFIFVHSDEGTQWKTKYNHLDFVSAEKYVGRYAEGRDR